MNDKMKKESNCKTDMKKDQKSGCCSMMKKTSESTESKKESGHPHLAAKPKK